MGATTLISVIGLVVSIVSVSAVVYFNSKNSKHTDAKDVEEHAKERIEEIKERTKENAVINAKLESIISSSQEIKEQIASLVKKVDAHGDRITKVEENLKSVWKRVEHIEQRLEKEDMDER